MTTARLKPDSAANAQPAGDAFDGGAFYRVGDWANGYFTVSDRGTVVAGSGCAPGKPGIDMLELVTGLRERGVNTPVLLRFADILDDRIRALADAFGTAIKENAYAGSYRPVFPIKVNQQRQVVEEIEQFGAAYGCGIEVGSKPELLAVMAITPDDRLILCNGFKDAAYIEAVVLATKLGRTIIPIVEKLSEVHHIIDFAKKYDVRPIIGVRVKLAARGEGRWSTSAGVKSKFGLFVSETLEMVEMLRAEGMLDCLQLLHCHAGSQMEDIRAVKDIVTELAHVYVGLVRAGAGMKYLDVGGGLGVDYRGVQSTSPSSINYTIEEYASDIVHRVGSVCTGEEIDHPIIITECGRAMTAYSSVLVFDILGASGPKTLASAKGITLPDDPDTPQPLLDLHDAYTSVSPEKYDECYHDAEQARDAAMSLFKLGYLTLEQRALAERMFWSTCERVQRVVAALPEGDVPEDLAGLDDLLGGIYFCNFSLFQSLPDSWAIDQLFPIAPIHRLHETPTERVILADITCDSDGQVSGYIGEHEPEASIALHPLRKGEPYYVGVFLVGAYQEVLGDLHNLFGDAHAVHVRMENGHWAIEEIVKGDTASQVLGYMQHDAAQLTARLGRDCERAVRSGRMTVREARVLQNFYERGLSSYTYLEADDAGDAS
ncbi:MAG: biosynthetic arginine decarboxylase [Phycisphaeraceae bacterium]|nr:MAG: biosynthetic arginine decarboxylase [Phycisphaeraceae bacterium]